MQKLGLIVNPVAGIGGRVGLKGSDGLEVQRQALALGAVPQAGWRAAQALERLRPIKSGFDLFTYPGEMGEDTARQCGFSPIVLGSIKPGETTAEDTYQAAKDLLAQGVDLLLFAGGDGTAHDIYISIGDALPVLGIPAGVKIHSAAFGVNPAAAGELAVVCLKGTVSFRTVEVMDIDEEAFRQGRVSARLYGYLRVPYRRNLLQGLKAGSSLSEAAALESIAEEVVQEIQPDGIYILGPGTTVRAIAARLGLEKTLLGVDVIVGGEMTARDVSEARLSELIQDDRLRSREAWIIVAPIGGQGFLFGRGNQPISPLIIRRVGKEHLRVVSTAEKIQALQGKPLLVDTGDLGTDDYLSGYLRVVTGKGEALIYRVDYFR